MKYHIVCPIQTPGDFDFGRCMACQSFRQDMSNPTRLVSCRKNRTPEHKKDFEGAYWSHLVGIKGRVVIDAAEEHRKERLP